MTIKVKNYLLWSKPFSKIEMTKNYATGDTKKKSMKNINSFALRPNSLYKIYRLRVRQTLIAS